MKSLLLIVLLFVSNQLLAHEVLLKLSLSPAGSFEAKTNKMEGTVKKVGNKYSSDKLSLMVSDLTTGIELRDNHFRKHLNFEKYPKIYMTNIIAENGKGEGILFVNNEKQKINFEYKNTSDKKIEATFKVIPSSFKLKEAKYLEIGVDDEVEIVAIIVL